MDLEEHVRCFSLVMLLYCYDHLVNYALLGVNGQYYPIFFFADNINASMLFPVQNAHTFWFGENQNDAMILFSSIKS